MTRTSELLLVGAGGAVGSVFRYLVALAFGRAVSGAFPWGTLTVNVVGSFLIELVLAFALASSSMPNAVRLLLATGFLGGFTTYSTFNHDVIALLRDGHVATMLGYLCATVVGALMFGALGYWLGRLAWAQVA